MSSACLQTTLMHSKSLETCSTYLVRQTYVISYYSAPDSRAEYCDDRVCLSVCTRPYLRKYTFDHSSGLTPWITRTIYRYF